MRPPVHNQRDVFNDPREEYVIDCSAPLPSGEPNVDATRQEFKKEADVNTILNRFAVTGVMPPLRTPIYGERDFDIDLHTGYLALDDAQRAFNKLPRQLRERYGTFTGLLDAIHNKTFKDDLQRAIDEEAALAGLDREAPPPEPPIVPPSQ